MPCFIQILDKPGSESVVCTYWPWGRDVNACGLCVCAWTTHSAGPTGAPCSHISVAEGSASSWGNLQLWGAQPAAVVVIISSCGSLNLQLWWSKPPAAQRWAQPPRGFLDPNLIINGMRALNNLPVSGPPALAPSDAALCILAHAYFMLHTNDVLRISISPITSEPNFSKSFLLY